MASVFPHLWLSKPVPYAISLCVRKKKKRRKNKKKATYASNKLLKASKCSILLYSFIALNSECQWKSQPVLQYKKKKGKRGETRDRNQNKLLLGVIAHPHIRKKPENWHRIVTGTLLWTIFHALLSMPGCWQKFCLFQVQPVGLSSHFTSLQTWRYDLSCICRLGEWHTGTTFHYPVCWFLYQLANL